MPGALAKEAVRRWDLHESAQPVNQDWIRQELVDVAQSEAREVVRSIQDAARKLTDALDAAGRLLPGIRGEDRFDLVELVKNMPVPEPKLPEVTFKRPSWLIRALGLARWQIERQINARVGSQMTDFFSDHGRLLELWIRSTLSELEHSFEERAENYRAQLQRLTIPPESASVDQASVGASLASLKQYVPAEETSATA